MITLYRKNAVGIGYWSIWAGDEPGVINIAHGTTLDSSPIHHREVVAKGLQGRSLEEQVQSRINSRVSRQRDKGYVEDIDTAAQGAFNQLGLTPPMLAQSYDEHKHVGEFQFQRKLNGHRCLITRQNGQVIAYSRRGKEFQHIHEIIEEVSPFIGEGDTFDGELYIHGEMLQTIGSYVKRRQAGTKRLIYAIYDQIEGVGFKERYDDLLQRGIHTDRVVVLPANHVDSADDIMTQFSIAVRKGFEGLMLRQDGISYEPNKRSKSLLKVKGKFDTEVIVKDIVLSDKGFPVAVAEFNGLEFRTQLPGGRSENMRDYENKDQRIGTLLTIEYRELTADGKPFHAVGINWRND